MVTRTLQQLGEAPIQEGQRICEQGRCVWRFARPSTGDSIRLDDPKLQQHSRQTQAIHAVDVDSGSGAVSVLTSSEAAPLSPQEYARKRRLGRAVVRAARALPEVRALCSSLKKHSQRPDSSVIGCVLWPELQDEPDCKPNKATPELWDDCLHGVYVGELQQTHASRHITILVDGNAQVKGVSLYGDYLTLSQWRSQARADAAGRP